MRSVGIATRAQCDVRVEDDELEELEPFDSTADEPADLLGTRQVDRGVRHCVDAHRAVGEELLVELRPGPARHRVGIGSLEAPDRDVIDGVA